MSQPLNLRVMPPNSSRMVRVINVDTSSGIWMSATDAEQIGLNVPNEDVVLEIGGNLVTITAREALELYRAWRVCPPGTPATMSVHRAVVSALESQLTDLDVIGDD